MVLPAGGGGLDALFGVGGDFGRFMGFGMEGLFGFGVYFGHVLFNDVGLGGVGDGLGIRY